MAEFELISVTRSGTYLATFPFRDLQGEFGPSKVQNIRFTTGIDFLKNMSKSQLWPGLTEVNLLRNGVSIFRGPLWHMQVSTSESKVSYMASGIESYLDLRLVGLTGKVTAPRSDLGWSLINHTQSLVGGNLGITRGTAIPSSSSVARSITWKPYENLMKMHEDIAGGVRGFDWEITPDRKYHQYEKIRRSSNVRIEYGGNIRNYSIGYDGKYARNWFIVTGKENAASQVLINANSRDKYGLRQYTENYSSISSKASLEAMNLTNYTERNEIKITPQVSILINKLSPFDGDIRPLEMAHVIIDNGWDNVDQEMRCVGFQLTVGKHFEETYVLYFNDDREIEDEEEESEG